METPEQRRAARRADRAARHEAQLGGLAAGWDPKRNPAATADAYKTLFVARLAYETTERRLLKEFEVFGPIQSVRLVKDQAGLSRGYAFIEYKDGEDLKRAYRRGDGLRIDGRRVLVDVERARTVRGACVRARVRALQQHERVPVTHVGRRARRRPQRAPASARTHAACAHLARLTRVRPLSPPRPPPEQAGCRGGWVAAWATRARPRSARSRRSAAGSHGSTRPSAPSTGGGP